MYVYNDPYYDIQIHANAAFMIDAKGCDFKCEKNSKKEPKWSLDVEGTESHRGEEQSTDGEAKGADAGLGDDTGGGVTGRG